MPVLLASTVPVVGPFLALAAGVLFVILAIARWKIHAFFALMLAAMLVGLIVAVGGFGKLTLFEAIERPVFELGSAAGKIAFVIAMAAVIGECLTVSGGAERIVTCLRFVAQFGLGVQCRLCVALQRLQIRLPILPNSF